MTEDQHLQDFMALVKSRNPHQPEFLQAVEEVAESVMPFVLDHKVYQDHKILERVTEPDRVVSFRVAWTDDAGEIQVNRGWRVQFCHAIGPYKGGLRFHPTVTESVLKFLGFEQIFKNSLTGLPMGGGKGGSNFDPKGRSDREVMRFCQSFMTELWRHIGENTDVPAGDIGVGAREIGYLFGQYRRLANRWDGTLTGKGQAYGGSTGRTEATGYGAVYFLQNMLAHNDETLSGKRVAISGSGNVALYAAELAQRNGARVVTLSDSGGSVFCPEGFNDEQLAFAKELKEQRRGRIAEFAEKYTGVEYSEGKAPWGAQCDIAMPCATQNELDAEAARTLANNGTRYVVEGANMPTTPEAVAMFAEAKVSLAPGKASNAGGVSVSGLEQSQNAQRVSWSKDEVDERLTLIMKDIHNQCVEYGTNGSGKPVDYIRGANIAGFKKVADVLVAYGVG